MRLSHSHTLSILAVLGVLTTAGCSKKDGGPTNSDPNADIPADPGGVAPVTQFNNILPSGSFSCTVGNEIRIRLNLLGVVDPRTGQPLPLGAGEIFVTEDGVLKGKKVSQPVTNDRLRADVAFIVDDSGSMGEEADSIASRITAFARSLEARNMDVRVGCVGHGYNSDQRVYGALDLTTAQSLEAYLGRGRGLGRTVGFTGRDSAALASAARGFGGIGGGENSIIGIRFADQHFSWRPGANRVYVAFTDEPTQPGGDTALATRQFVREWRSGAGRGTVHMVYSSDTTGYWVPNHFERPWDLATLTGGTIKLAQRDAAGLDLESLPVTGVIAASRLVEFKTSSAAGIHKVVVTVKTATADGFTVFSNISYAAPARVAIRASSVTPRREIQRDAAGQLLPAPPDPVR
ncbi:MAG TPA: vWA domain-containing protein [Methylomirabilota bacterium]|jgi:hypothetical protein|nr:vWA domain-containing protein [Methylomirabilota bacterium]